MDTEHLGPDDAIQSGMLRWEPGTLSTTVLRGVAIDVLADLWQDCYRRGDCNEGERRRRFRRELQTIIYSAIGEEWEIVR